MRPATRLATYAVLVAAIGGGAAGVGLAVGPVEDDAPAHAAPASSQEGANDMSMGEHEGGAVASGLAIANDDYRLVVDEGSFDPGEPGTLRFRILDPTGKAIDDMELHGGVRMHLIVVRRDLTGYQHLHPTLQPDGAWATELTLPEPGAYRAFADFERDGAKTVLGADLLAGGTFSPIALPAARTQLDVDGFGVRLDGSALAGEETELTFRITGGDRPAALEDYLGARGHLVALREGDLAYLHVHPVEGGEDGQIAFEATFPSAGRYRLFLQFQVDGRVHTAAFTLEVGA
ncbi:MAG: hypothetical protein R3C15_04195 [Thermoleophilia bacterium]